MLKYSIGWRPLYGGGRLFRPLLRLFLTFLSQIFCKMSNFYMCRRQRKKLEFINSFYPPEIGRYFLSFFSLHELRLFCMNWGCFAQIEVVLHRLRLPCTDWGCPAQIEPCTDWGCPAQIEVAMNSLKEDITLSILRALSAFVVESEIKSTFNLYKCSSFTLDLPWNLFT